jgi:hypothetical protein
VLLIPCDDQGGENEDCRDTVSLGTPPALQATSTKVHSQATWNEPNTKSVPTALRALLAGRYHGFGAQGKSMGHPLWGTHKKMNESDEQELREFMRSKHHSHGLKNQHLG